MAEMTETVGNIEYKCDVWMFTLLVVLFNEIAVHGKNALQNYNVVFVKK
jgi:hypothetical protein